MAEIIIHQEHRHDRRWQYDAEVREDSGRHRFDITLSWAEYNLWCRSGDEPPQKVVKAVLRFLLERESASSILSKFDCSVVRRYFPEVDDQLPRMI